MKTLLVGINAKYIHSNLAIRYLQTNCGDNISIQEYTINQNIMAICSDIMTHDFDIIGFSSYIWNSSMVFSLATLIKQISPNKIVVVGGPEVSYHSKEILNAHPSIDYIISGEGETPFKILLHNLTQSDWINHESIVSKKSLQVPKYCQEAAFSELKFPYTAENFPLGQIVYYEFSRGCPFNCSYCLSSTFSSVRNRSLVKAKQEILWFIEQKITLIKFVDRTFNAHPESLDLVRWLCELKPNLTCHFEICADTLNEAWFSVLETAPKDLFQFEIGVQSTHEKTLSAVHRHTNLERLYNSIHRLKAMDNAHLHLDLIVGLPYETYDIFKKSFNDVFQLEMEALQIGFLKILKGSEMAQNTEVYHMEHTEFAPYEILSNRWMCYKEIQQLKQFEDAVEKFYNSENFYFSIKAYIALFNTPFEAFEVLGKFLEAHFFAKQSSLCDLCLLLSEAFVNHTDNSEAIGYFQSLLQLDYWLNGREKTRLMLTEQNSITKMEIQHWFSEKIETVWALFPHYHGEKKEILYKKISIMKLTRDLRAAIGELVIDSNVERNSFVFIDYGKKTKGKRANFKLLVEDALFLC